MRKDKVCDCDCHRIKGEFNEFTPCCNVCYQLGTVCVTGANSMIGRQLVNILKNYGFVVYEPSKANMNLLSYDHTMKYLEEIDPDYIIHLAGYNGGISFNQKKPADIYQQTAYMAMNILSEGSVHCQKIVSVLPSCAYSAFDELDEPRSMLFEKELEDGEPHPSVECHGLAKRILFDYSRQLHKQFKSNLVCCVLNNCYGPFDHYGDPDRLKVAGALIEKFVGAKLRNDESVEIWGTGNPQRELMYSKDAAAGIFYVFQKYDDPTEVINIGPGTEVSIRELAYTIKEAVGYKGEIRFDTNRPDGQMRKLLCCDKIQNMGWKSEYTLAEGIKETVEWYKENAVIKS